jgi:addiction module HigA family antidote
MSRNPFRDLGFSVKEAAALHRRSQKTALTYMHNPPHPGEIIRDTVLAGDGDLSVTEFAKQLGVSRVALSRVINARVAVSAELAIRLSAALGGSAESWLRMQVAYDLAKA